MLATKGYGVITTATLLVTAGDNPGRIRTEASFAALCGAAPIPASSGKTNRHRLNRGGDRQANWALHQIALVRLSSDPRTKAYAARLTATGKNCKEILRCPRTRHRPRSMAPADPPPTRTPHRRPAPTAPRTRTHPHPSRPPPEHPPGPDQRTRTRHTPRHHPHRSIPPMAQHPTTTDPHRLTPIGASRPRPGTPQEPHPHQFSTGSTEVLASGARVRLWSRCRRPALGTRPAPRTYPSAFPNGGGSACSMHIPRPPRRPLPLRADPRDALERAAERSDAGRRFDAQRFRPRRRARRSAAGRRA